MDFRDIWQGDMAGSLQDYHPSVSFDFDIMASLEKFKVADSPFYISHKKLNSPLNKGVAGEINWGQ